MDVRKSLDLLRMTLKRPWGPVFGLALLAAGCVEEGPQSMPGDDQPADTEPGNEEGTSGGPGATSSVPDEGSGEDTSPGEGSSTGCSFIDCGETGTVGEPQCDVLEQDCPDGEKCMPWANDGGLAWNATRCVPIDPAPGQPGDSCTVEGSAVSGFDSCDSNSMCWNVDENNEGTCVPFCGGTIEQPTCEGANQTCAVYNEGVLMVCLPICDPLLGECAEGEACIPNTSGAFNCVFDASGESGAFGDPCEAANGCDPGLFCANAATVPGCTDSLGCCSEFCPVDTGTCMGTGQTCQPAFEEGDAPPGLENVGVCALPQ